MDNNRTIITVVLVVLLFSAYTIFFAPQQPVQQAETETSAPVQTADQQAPSAADTTATSPAHEMLNIDAQEKTLLVHSDYYNIELSSIGAVVRSIDLNKYKETNEPDSGNFVLFNGIASQLSTLQTTGSDGLYIPSNLNYKLVDVSADSINVSNDKQAVTFVSQTEALEITKTYVFYPASYEFDINVSVRNISPQSIQGSLNLSLNTPWDEDEKGSTYTFVGPQSYDGNDLLEDKVSDLKKSPKIYTDNIVWSGYTSKYFISAINPHDTSSQTYIRLADNHVENRISTKQITLASDKTASFNYAAYFGPKQFELLAYSGNDFEATIHYGFFHPLAKPLMVVLKFFYSFIGNYGFSIILLTVCIKIIFWPLTQKSYKSMKGMQKLQPEMKRLREKYGSDKQRLNQEMMSFYKEHKVNPLGGCLPMLIQIPVFFALYRVLLGSIELRHAPFMLWITDLSAKDPYYITPLIMGVTMFLQQKMTPTNMDPTQEKIMLMMPVVFTFMFLNFPSGLVVYWLVNNVLTILQQYLIRRQPD